MVALVLGYLCWVFGFRKIEIMIYNVYIYIFIFIYIYVVVVIF